MEKTTGPHLSSRVPAMPRVTPSRRGTKQHIWRCGAGVRRITGGNWLYPPTWWLIPLSKWVITPVINGISRVNPLITGVITHLLSGMSHQVVGDMSDMFIGEYILAYEE